MHWSWRLLGWLALITWLLAIAAAIVAIRLQSQAIHIATPRPIAQGEPLIALWPTSTPTVNIWLLPTITAIPTSTPLPTPLPTTLPTPTATALVVAPTAPLLTATPAAWLNGGSLHQSTVAEWYNADPGNQIATIRDWVATGFNLKGADLVNVQAQSVITCIDTSLANYALVYTEKGSMSNLAWLCMMAVQGQPLIYPPVPTPVAPPSTPTPMATALPNTLATLFVIENYSTYEILGIRNNTSAILDMSGWLLYGSIGIEQCKIPSGALVQPGQVYQVATGNSQPNMPGYKCGDKPIWNNDGETIYLQLPNETISTWATVTYPSTPAVTIATQPAIIQSDVALPFEEICGNNATLTDLQQQDIAASMTGKRVIGWVGKVYDVEFRDGVYKVQVDMRNDTFRSSQVEILGIDRAVATSLRVDQVITFDGTIQSVDTFLDDICYPLNIVNATIR